MTEVRAVMESDQGLSNALWKQVCAELALPGLAIAEADGGQGFGLKELGIALGETGRCLAPIPLFSVAGLVAPAIAAAAPDADRAAWLDPIAQGSRASLAWVEASGSWSVDETRTEVGPDGRISGEKCFVLDGGSAERFFVIARRPGSHGEDGLGLHAVDAAAPGVSVRRLESLDPTRGLARIRFEGAPSRCVGEATGSDFAQALRASTALLCAEMIGGMERVLETAVEYASTRFQFGRPIGSFQAIKHKAADMLIDFEGARTASASSIEALDADDPEASLLVAVAKAATGPAYVRMTTENIQIHGGVGYTWEYDAHLFYRRAQSSAILLGDASWHRERVAWALAGVEAR